MTNEQNSNGFYPVPYLILNISGEFKLHLDQGDYSFQSQRTLRFNPKRVVHKGLIRYSDEYPLIKGAILEANRIGRFNPDVLEDALGEVAAS